MKIKNYIVILVCILLVVASILFIIFSFNTKSIDKLIEDENIQVETLNNVYKDMLSKVNTDNANIILDQSSLKNILTGEELTQENISKLKELEKNSESEEKYILYTKYSKETYTLILEVIGSGVGNTKTTQKYKLEVKDGDLVYVIDGEGTRLFE